MIEKSWTPIYNEIDVSLVSNRFQTSYCARSAHVNGQLNRFFLRSIKRGFAFSYNCLCKLKLQLRNQELKPRGITTLVIIHKILGNFAIMKYRNCLTFPDSTNITDIFMVTSQWRIQLIPYHTTWLLLQTYLDEHRHLLLMIQNIEHNDMNFWK